ncbi:MAG: tetratricopeptide repeat protein [Verrucomicrobiaceae bacterium]
MRLLLLLTFGLLATYPACAELGAYRTALLDEAVKLMKTEEWAKAEEKLATLSEFRATPGNLKPSIWGPICYYRGICAFRQKKWDQAARFFEKCYTKYPSTRTDKNPYHLRTLRCLADSLHHSGDFERASKMYRKYIYEIEVAKKTP